MRTAIFIGFILLASSINFNFLKECIVFTHKDILILVLFVAFAIMDFLEYIIKFIKI